jgi:hypothetical protein
MEEKEDDIYTFIGVCENFVKSSLELRDAAALCKEDSIKQDMIAFVVPDFNKMWARSEGIKVLLEKEDFSENKEFVLEEMKSVTRENQEIAKKIKDKLASLD